MSLREARVVRMDDRDCNGLVKSVSKAVCVLVSRGGASAFGQRFSTHGREATNPAGAALSLYCMYKKGKNSKVHTFCAELRQQLLLSYTFFYLLNEAPLLSCGGKNSKDERFRHGD